MLKTAIAAALVLGGVAQAAEDSGFYAGAGVGQISYKASLLGFDLDASDTAFKLFGGYRINRNLAVEGAYIDGGNPEDTSQGITFGLDTSALQASLKGILPFSPTVSGYAKAGILVWEAKSTATDGFDLITADSDGNDFAWGAGVEFAFSPTVQGRIEYEGADIGGTDYSLISAGVAWMFR